MRSRRKERNLLSVCIYVRRLRTMYPMQPEWPRPAPLGARRVRALHTLRYSSPPQGDCPRSACLPSADEQSRTSTRRPPMYVDGNGREALGELQRMVWVPWLDLRPQK
jgi:hypothetical protein